MAARLHLVYYRKLYLIKNLNSNNPRHPRPLRQRNDNGALLARNDILLPDRRLQPDSYTEEVSEHAVKPVLVQINLLNGGLRQYLLPYVAVNLYLKKRRWQQEIQCPALIQTAQRLRHHHRGTLFRLY